MKEYKYTINGNKYEVAIGDIEENIVTLCPKCHHDFDNGFKREQIGAWISEYLDKWYPDFPDEKRKYSKYRWLDD